MFEWLATQQPIFIYIFLIISSLLESIFPPHPADVFVLVFAFVAGQGHFNPYLVFPSTVTGSFAGIMVLYCIGKYKGDKVIQYLTRSSIGKIFSIELIEKIKRKFSRYGILIILVHRFFPGTRTIICFTAGVVKIDTRKYFFCSLISTMIWNFTLVLVGFYVGSTWDAASKFLKDYNIIATLTLIGVLLLLIMLYFIKKKLIK
jgi:membrane protein DedA with SNARE-associated domain